MSEHNPSETGVQSATGTDQPVDENTIIAERRTKLTRLREQGVAFPNDFRPAHRAADLATHHGFKIGRAHV